MYVCTWGGRQEAKQAALCRPDLVLRLPGISKHGRQRQSQFKFIAMSGLEIFGAVGTVFGLVGAVKGCIDLLDIIATARSTTRDLEDLLIHLQWQYIQFASWVVESGFGDIIMHEAEHGSQDLEQALAHLPRQFRTELFLALVKTTMGNMSRSLRKAHSLICRYDGVTIAPTDTLFGDWAERIKHLKLHRGSPTAIVVRSASALPQPGAASDAGTRKSGVRDMIRWVAGDNRQLSGLYENVCRYNRDLAIALPDSRVHCFERRVERGIATSGPITSRLGTAPRGLDLVLEAPGTSDTYRQTQARTVITLQIALKNFEPQTTADGVPGIPPRNPIGATLSATASLGLGNVSLRLSDIRFAHPRPPTTSSVQHREFVMFRSSPAVLEWRYYSTRASRQTLAHLDSRVQMLTMQLQQLSTLADAGVLTCLGYVHDEKSARHGLVYAYPDGVAPPPTPISLRERLHRDLATTTRRDRDARLACARRLVLSVHRLLSVSWLHKNLTAESVLLFENDAGGPETDPDADDDGLPPPFLAAFSFARRDAQLELSERLASVYHQKPAHHPPGRSHRMVAPPPPDENEHMLYWHPDRCRIAAGTLSGSDGAPQHVAHVAQSYRRGFDVYSLGVLLLEIGLWCPIEPIARKAGMKDPESFAVLLRTKYVKSLRGKMGARYAHVVGCCLRRDFGRSMANCSGGGTDGSEGEVLTEEDYLAGVRLFLEDFETQVVSAMESV
ncbi:hypothetical protein BT67DRAFT_258999 [Trichocladium antarcticum]|uniref:Prion-inhibition and propagation HeLo domain-containing protein n=1 Tax=Trichocladium antarcticum TaxID=1450529 RepID=A0AAN6UMF0_9PEZI|nr:hypothetical protein BT67DRAFT_258999 [Trichocladium antarcticum]